MRENILEKHPVIILIGIVGAVDAIFALFGLDKFELSIITFFVSLIATFIYFDGRIFKIEKIIEEVINKLKMDKKGITQFTLVVVIILVILLILFLLDRRNIFIL